MFKLTDKGISSLQLFLQNGLKIPNSLSLDEALERAKQIDDGIVIPFNECRDPGNHNLSFRGDEVVADES